MGAWVPNNEVSHLSTFQKYVGVGTALGMNRLVHLQRFYELVEECTSRLGGPRRLSECTGRLEWPRRGVYFFFEPGEARGETGTGSRIVRVGTHALKAGSKTALWNRLSQHRGSKSSGGGNHRGSIFRLLVGAAWLQKHSVDCATWGVGSSAPPDLREKERSLEQRVSELIGRMEIAWLAIDDEPGPNSLRGFIERNSIALLSNLEGTSLDPPSSQWLGHSCPRPLVARSGLWNQNHVNENYNPAFLDQFESLAAKTNVQ